MTTRIAGGVWRRGGRPALAQPGDEGPWRRGGRRPTPHGVRAKRRIGRRAPFHPGDPRFEMFLDGA
jgi:hypothetical protein